MKKYLVYLLFAVIAFIGLDMTYHAGMAGASSVTEQAVSLLKNRYGITSTPEEINGLHGASLNSTELGYLNGVTSNVQTQLDAKVSTTLSNAKIYIGNASNVAVAQTMSGDATITNAGVLTLAANSVSAPQFGPINSVSLVIATGTTTNSVAVEAGSRLLTVLPRSGFSNDYTMTNAVYTGGTLTVDTDAHPADMQVDAVFLRP